MIPIYMKSKHNPPNSYGDCWSACMASILEREDIPHFLEDGDPNNDWIERTREYLATIDVSLWRTWYGVDNLSEVLFTMKEINPDMYYILSGDSPSGPHSVVCLNDEIVHDPAGRPKGEQIVGPCANDVYWVEVLAIGINNKRIK